MRRKNLNISYKENQRGRRHIYSVKAVNTNNGNYVEFELEIPKIYLMENVMVRSVALREIEYDEDICHVNFYADEIIGQDAVTDNLIIN